MAVDVTTSSAPSSMAGPDASPLLGLTRAVLPLFFLQPLLGRIVRRIARNRPELFNRIGLHKDKSFLIDPVNMPFALMLYPQPECPRLKAVRGHEGLVYDARIAASFLTLLDMVDGRLDGDSLFFTRELVVEGDIEAVVCLRNAFDDLEGSIADDIAAMFGAPGRHALSTLRRMRDTH